MSTLPRAQYFHLSWDQYLICYAKLLRGVAVSSPSSCLIFKWEPYLSNRWRDFRADPECLFVKSFEMKSICRHLKNSYRWIQLPRLERFMEIGLKTQHVNSLAPKWLGLLSPRVSCCPPPNPSWLYSRHSICSPATCRWGNACSPSTKPTLAPRAAVHGGVFPFGSLLNL